MSKQFTPKVVTANHLLDGDVIYLDANDSWVRNLAYANLLDDAAVADAKLAFAQAQIGDVVGVYLMDVRATPVGPAPTHFRETFRATGPSNYNHGKQENSHV